MGLQRKEERHPRQSKKAWRWQITAHSGTRKQLGAGNRLSSSARPREVEAVKQTDDRQQQDNIIYQAVGSLRGLGGGATWSDRYGLERPLGQQ